VVSIHIEIGPKRTIAATFGDLVELFFFAEETPFNTAFSPKANRFHPDLQNTSGGGTINKPGVKSKDPDPGSGSGMNNPNHISESLETIFWVKILKFLMRIRDGKNSDPGSGMEKFGSETLLFPHIGIIYGLRLVSLVVPF
jgi:hypothetical protein